MANISINVIGKQFSTMASKMINFNNNLSTIWRRPFFNGLIVKSELTYKIHGYDLRTLRTLRNTIFHFCLMEI